MSEKVSKTGTEPTTIDAASALSHLAPIKEIFNEAQNTKDSGFDENSLDKGSHIIIPFKPLNPLYLAGQGLLQSSAINDPKPVSFNVSEIQGSENYNVTRGKEKSRYNE